LGSSSDRRAGALGRVAKRRPSWRLDVRFRHFLCAQPMAEMCALLSADVGAECPLLGCPFGPGYAQVGSVAAQALIERFVSFSDPPARKRTGCIPSTSASNGNPNRPATASLGGLADFPAKVSRTYRQNEMK